MQFLQDVEKLLVCYITQIFKINNGHLSLLATLYMLYSAISST